MKLSCVKAETETRARVGNSPRKNMTHYVTVMFIEFKNWGVYAAHMGAWELLSTHETKADADARAKQYNAKFV